MRENRAAIEQGARQKYAAGDTETDGSVRPYSLGRVGEAAGSKKVGAMECSGHTTNLTACEYCDHAGLLHVS
jgi:hypothetical protein